jgi:hypothetical protein
MNEIWRFYSGEDHKWRWQCLSMYGVLIAESQTACKDYETCRANAQASGYDFFPSNSEPEPARATRAAPKKRMRW